MTDKEKYKDYGDCNGNIDNGDKFTCMHKSRVIWEIMMMMVLVIVMVMLMVMMIITCTRAERNIRVNGIPTRAYTMQAIFPEMRMMMMMTLLLMMMTVVMLMMIMMMMMMRKTNHLVSWDGYARILDNRITQRTLKSRCCHDYQVLIKFMMIIILI